VIGRRRLIFSCQTDQDRRSAGSVPARVPLLGDDSGQRRRLFVSEVRTENLLCLKGIDDLEEGKTVEVGVSSDDLSDAVLSHEDRCVGVVQQIAR
jgi:hypothetical protein